jgi:hypothetical protein
MGDRRTAYRILGGKIDLREIGWNSMDWIDVAQDKEHGTEPSGSIKCWEILEWLHNWQLLK